MASPAPDEGQDEPAPGPDPAEGSIFSSLPRQRPGLRSRSRRAFEVAEDAPEAQEGTAASGATEASGAEGARSAGEPSPATGGAAADPPPPAGGRDPRNARRPDARPEPPATPPPTSGSPLPKNVGDVAWAGVAVAAETAAAGVRAATRLLESMRGAQRR